MSATLPTLILKPGEAYRIVAGHPWVYRSSILRQTATPTDGELAQVKDHRQRLLGVGCYNSKSKISVRVLAPERITLDQPFFDGRLAAALALRQRHLPRATSFRVVNAESDFLSGLIVDKYEDVVVLQISALGMERHKEKIVTAVRRLLSPKIILERSDAAARKFEGLPEANGVVWAATPVDAGNVSTTVTLNGLKFAVDLLGGHKTGMYLDQQANYQAVGALASGADVLDCFSFLGGFGLHAARAGARRVHLLDQSEAVVQGAQRNAGLNGLTDRVTAETANVFDWLKARTTVRPHERVIPRYDLIVLDPPSFTRNRASVGDALRGYKEIHLRALKLLKPGGVLATFCCSHHVGATTFQDVILSAAYDTRHLLRRIATYAQGLDHPILPMIPETEYLKGFAFELVR
ncbi:MAG TPA: class I SAM-dependent rRNA methyltransferase [Verrucomicrobiota bacterium]|nr:class I SAM-dependent rRNA methyltransferase [Verrucomicrobiota bacterium]HNT15029.1 class I SAM-dependent rRNA methyltransferase [Verrucomicrobiota bacterium]